jgi:hypothetical protein
MTSVRYRAALCGVLAAIAVIVTVELKTNAAINTKAERFNYSRAERVAGSNCHTTCYWVGNQQHCNTNCY